MKYEQNTNIQLILVGMICWSNFYSLLSHLKCKIIHVADLIKYGFCKYLWLSWYKNKIDKTKQIKLTIGWSEFIFCNMSSISDFKLKKCCNSKIDERYCWRCICFASSLSYYLIGSFCSFFILTWLSAH